jgi:hypothetical protein
MGLAAAPAEAAVRLQPASTAACRCVTSCRILIRRECLPRQFFGTCQQAIMLRAFIWRPRRDLNPVLSTSLAMDNRIFTGMIRRVAFVYLRDRSRIPSACSPPLLTSFRPSSEEIGQVDPIERTRNSSEFWRAFHESSPPTVGVRP